MMLRNPGLILENVRIESLNDNQNNVQCQFTQECQSTNPEFEPYSWQTKQNVCSDTNTDQIVDVARDFIIVFAALICKLKPEYWKCMVCLIIGSRTYKINIMVERDLYHNISNINIYLVWLIFAFY